jgi:hypothetical protein
MSTASSPSDEDEGEAAGLATEATADEDFFKVTLGFAWDLWKCRTACQPRFAVGRAQDNRFYQGRTLNAFGLPKLPSPVPLVLSAGARLTCQDFSQSHHVLLDVIRGSKN